MATSGIGMQDTSEVAAAHAAPRRTQPVAALRWTL